MLLPRLTKVLWPLLAWTISTVHSIAINNGIVGTPSVQCAVDHIALHFTTQAPFQGRVFVKGYAYQTECSMAGNGATADSFRVTFNQCGVRRSRQITGIALSATVIVSFHSLFLTKVDKAYRVNCFYMESSKHVTQNIDVSMLTTVPLDGQVAMPICRYEILSGNAQGPPVRFARIGDPVYHKWTCDSDVPNTFCIRVHSCTVDDGTGGDRIQVLDADGCSIDKYILQNLDYTSDMMAGQEAHVFKFADRPALFFNCEIEIRLKDSSFGCTNVQPNCVRVDPINGFPTSQPIGPGGPGYAQPVINSGGALSYGGYTPYVPITQQAYAANPNVLPNFGNSALGQQWGNQGVFVPGPSLPVPTAPQSQPGLGLPIPAATLGVGTLGLPLAGVGVPQPPQRGPYLTALKRVKRVAVDETVNPLVADFDLPQKRLTVFDIDTGLDDPESTDDELREARRIVDLLTQPQLRTSSADGRHYFMDNMVCLTNEKFVGYAVALAGVSVTSVTILAVVFVRRKSIFGIQWRDGKA